MIDNTPDSIHVTRPSLPPLEEFVDSLRDIWESRWLTNSGLYHDRFESALAEHLGVAHVSLFCNGTIALQVGLHALEISGEVITTPYSFPATTHAVHWNHCTPVFCDIDPTTCNMDPSGIESLITPRTTCILPTHVYGIPCDDDPVRRVADKHKLRVFYDAAHAFGVKSDNGSILSLGDLSMVSFHATKVFNTAEGGALITDDPGLKDYIEFLRNFGFADETTVVAPGTNGKMNELQAAYGLLQLKYIDGEIEKRRRVAQLYRSRLQDVPGVRLLAVADDLHWNYGYFPVFIDEAQYGRSRDELYEALQARGIYGRRYFYPLISEFPAYRDLASAAPDRLPVATHVSRQVICLPIYADLDLTQVEDICDEISRGITRTVA